MVGGGVYHSLKRQRRSPDHFVHASGSENYTAAVLPALIGWIELGCGMVDFLPGTRTHFSRCPHLSDDDAAGGLPPRLLPLHPDLSDGVDGDDRAFLSA